MYRVVNRYGNAEYLVETESKRDELIKRGFTEKPIEQNRKKKSADKVADKN